MRKRIIQPIKAIVTSIAILFATISYEQQYVIADKDNTRPEVNGHFGSPARITSLSVTPHNGYNEIRWSALGEQDTRKFIVEYSTDWVDFQSAGEIMTSQGNYQLAHKTSDILPLVYRLRIEGADGKYYYSQNILSDGIGAPPVKIYPTSITGNVVNVIAALPVQRVTVFSGNGQQMFSQDIGGKKDYMSIVIPSLSKGMYWMNFTGNDWKTTSTFIVP
jgi:hypothetical protein